MFETATPQSGLGLNFNRLVSYLLQLLLSYPVIGIVSQPMIFALANCGLNGKHPFGVYFAGYDLLVYLLIAGPVVGWLVGKFFTPTTVPGKWIWLPPLLLWTLAFYSEERLSHRDLPELFFSTSSNQGLGVFFLSRPAFAAVGYSCGIVLASWLGPLRPLNLWRWVVTLLLIGGAFAALSPQMALFEDLRLFDASAQPYLVIRPTLSLEPRPETICAGQHSGTIVISEGDMVVSGEQRACKGSTLLDPEAPLTPDVILVERIKVKSEKNAGAEGWVPASALAIQAYD